MGPDVPQMDYIEGAQGTCRQTYQSAGNSVTTSQCFLLAQNIFSKSRPVQAEGEGNVLMAKVALAAARAASLLPSIPVQELQLP